MKYYVDTEQTDTPAPDPSSVGLEILRNTDFFHLGHSANICFDKTSALP